MPANLQRSTCAKAIGRDLQVSPKASIELANFLRGKELERAIRILNRVIEKKEAIPYKRFTNGPGHKPGMAAGRYPVKAAGEFLELFANVKANASNQGLTGTLMITHLAVNRASESFRARAKERHTFKRCHVEVIVTQATAEDKKTKQEKHADKKTGAKGAKADVKADKSDAKSEKKEDKKEKKAEKKEVEATQ